jgi:hypothetical protein
MRLLEKRPADRYRNAADVVRAIDGLLAPAAAVIGDLLPTLSTSMGATAATRSGKPPAAPPRRRLGVLAGAATAAIALLILLLLRVSSVPVVGGPGAPDDHLSGAEHRARRPERLLRRVAYLLWSRGLIQPEWWLTRGVDMLLPRHHGGAFARLIHRIAGTRGTPGDVVAPLATAVAYLARRRRLRRVARLGVAPARSSTRDRSHAVRGLVRAGDRGACCDSRREHCRPPPTSSATRSGRSSRCRSGPDGDRRWLTRTVIV